MRRGLVGPVGFNPILDDYDEVLITSRPVTVVADTAVNSSESLTRPAGTYLFGYNLAGRLDNNTGSPNTVQGTVSIDDGSSIVPDSRAALSLNLNASQTFIWPISNIVRHTITVETTFTLEIISAQATASGNFRIEDSDVIGGITGDDNSSRFWALRIR